MGTIYEMRPYAAWGEDIVAESQLVKRGRVESRCTRFRWIVRLRETLEARGLAKRSWQRLELVLKRFDS